MNRKSCAKANTQPPPYACPDTTAMVGIGNVSNRSNNR